MTEIIELKDEHIPEVWKLIKTYPDFFSDEVSIKTFEDFTKWFGETNKGGIAGFFNGEFIGCAYLDNIHDSMGSVNIIFKRYLPPIEKLFLAKEGLWYFFQKYNLKMIYGITRITNHACISFMKRLGFSFTNVLKDHKTVNGKLTDYVFAGILKEAFDASV